VRPAIGAKLTDVVQTYIGRRTKTSHSMTILGWSRRRRGLGGNTDVSDTVCTISHMLLLPNCYFNNTGVADITSHWECSNSICPFYCAAMSFGALYSYINFITYHNLESEIVNEPRTAERWRFVTAELDWLYWSSYKYRNSNHPATSVQWPLYVWWQTTTYIILFSAVARFLSNTLFFYRIGLSFLFFITTSRNALLAYNTKHTWHFLVTPTWSEKRKCIRRELRKGNISEGICYWARFEFDLLLR